MNAGSFAILGFARFPLLAVTLFLGWVPPAHSASATDAAVGEAIYNKAGCVACHGTEAQGSSIAPRLSGHTAEQVRRYLRNPQGKMPRFGLDKISDSQLEAIASYLAGLPVPEAPVAPMDTLAALEMHHWMAHRALRSNDLQHSVHHLSHARDFITDDAHRRSMERVFELVRANRLEPAAYAVLKMLSANVTPGISMEQMHVRLALGSVEADDIKEAIHHLQHYIDRTSGHDRRHAEELLIRLKKGDLAAVRKRLGHLLAK